MTEPMTNPSTTVGHASDRRRPPWTALLAVAAAVALAACGAGSGDEAREAAGPAATLSTSAPSSTTPGAATAASVAPTAVSTTAAPPTTAAPTTAAPVATTAPTTTAVAGRAGGSGAGGALCIGDSIMLSASPVYYDTLASCGQVDATVSRQMYEAAEVIAGHAAAGLPSRVVLHLGTNGTIDPADLDAALAQLAGAARVVLVTDQLNGSRGWEAGNNAALRAAAARWPNVAIADWKGASDGTPDYFREDGLHPSQVGALAYAAVIDAAL